MGGTGGACGGFQGPPRRPQMCLCELGAAGVLGPRGQCSLSSDLGSAGGMSDEIEVNVFIKPAGFPLTGVGCLCSGPRPRPAPQLTSREAAASSLWALPPLMSEGLPSGHFTAPL